jgi:CRP-like cAMP-binding protein
MSNVNLAELRSAPLLAGLSDAGLARVVACAAELEAEEGQVLALQDDPGSGMFVIQEGTVAIELRSGALELGPGDFFGELALLVADGTRVARVRATSPVRCLSIPREDFLALVETEPSFALSMLRELARRLAEARAAV